MNSRVTETYEFDAIVIGAGIVGLAIAYELSTMYGNILVVEKENSFVASLGFGSIESQVTFLGLITFIIWAMESLFEYIYSGENNNLTLLLSPLGMTPCE